MNASISEKLLAIHRNAARMLEPVLVEIHSDNLYWHPAPASRSVGEIMRHLVRVDIMFLGMLGVETALKDPGEGASAPDLAEAHRDVQETLYAFLRRSTDEELSREIAGIGGRRMPVWEVIAHGAHHYAYHAAQMYYLRRALDRDWKTPTSLWSDAVDEISAMIFP